jgi:hypothetical protein
MEVGMPRAVLVGLAGLCLAACGGSSAAPTRPVGGTPAANGASSAAAVEALDGTPSSSGATPAEITLTTAADCQATLRRSSSRSAISLARASVNPPAWMNSTMWRRSSRSNQVPCRLHTSTTTWEQLAKLTRFINSLQTGQGRYWIFPNSTGSAGKWEAMPSTAACSSWSSQI